MRGLSQGRRVGFHFPHGLAVGDLLAERGAFITLESWYRVCLTTKLGSSLLSGFVNLIAHTGRTSPQRCHENLSMLGERQSASWFWDWPPQFLCRFDPLPDDDFNVCQCFLVCGAICSTARQLGHFGNEGLIILAPIDNDPVLTHRRRLLTYIAELPGGPVSPDTVWHGSLLATNSKSLRLLSL